MNKGRAPSLSFEQGLEMIVESIATILSEAVAPRPYLVAVHGWPHSGKSTFCRRGRDILYQRGLRGASIMNGDDDYQLWSGYAKDFLFIEDQPWIMGVQNFCQRYYQRHPNKHLLIVGDLEQLDILYNPTDGQYDAVIFNPEARRKPSR